MSVDYVKAGWINNMSAKASYRQVYHLRRLFSKAMREGDRKALATYARMIYVWSINEPTVTFAALRSHVNKGLK